MEQAIEEMIQEGYLIDRVEVLIAVDDSPQWIPLDELDILPDEAQVRLTGHNADGTTEELIKHCRDMGWLREWWRGGWQANI